MDKTNNQAEAKSTQDDGAFYDCILAFAKSLEAGSLSLELQEVFLKHCTDRN